ncbi:helix-turn-helix domain-containing protein [Bacillus sp. JJ1521]|uniref:helix-turn-helix domain-containing protein n=1 Tax=Bacillus sp. JJ1521 TaxID=3122957 RepID=UPI002FFE84ED
MKKRTYPYDLKKQLVELYLEGHSSTELAKKYDIHSYKRITDWVRKVREGGFKALEETRGRHSKGKSKKEEVTLEEKYEKLKLENEYLKKLLDLKRG